MPDLVIFDNGWELVTLVKLPMGYQAVIQRQYTSDFHPHFYTKFKMGKGKTQREACSAAFSAPKFVNESIIYGAGQYGRAKKPD